MEYTAPRDLLSNLDTGSNFTAQTQRHKLRGGFDRIPGGRPAKVFPVSERSTRRRSRSWVGDGSANFRHSNCIPRRDLPCQVRLRVAHTLFPALSEHYSTRMYRPKPTATPPPPRFSGPTTMRPGVLRRISTSTGIPPIPTKPRLPPFSQPNPQSRDRSPGRSTTALPPECRPGKAARDG